MKPTSQQFIDHIRSLRIERQQLNDLLDADPNGVYVYFLAPLSNVVRIWESGGIKPRNHVEDYIDISFQGIQNRRDRKIQIAGSEGSNYKNLHDCVNFFLNPMNATYFQFRRNALVQSQRGDPWSQLVCLLEIDLDALLMNDQWCWCVSDQNIASTSKSISNLVEVYEKFSWDLIYSVGKVHDEKEHNSLRSSEWVAFNNSPDEISMIPTECIHRVLAYSTDYRITPREVIDVLPHEITQFQNHNHQYQVLSTPLSYDKSWAASLNKISIACNTEMIINNLRRLKSAEEELGCSLEESFSTSNVALGIHGIGHTIRVMFWVLLLADLSNARGFEITEDEKTAAFYAAFAHDLCRMDNWEDEQHGEMAANKFKQVYKEKLSGDLLERCILAIHVHSLQEEPQDKDPIWMLLKDADALDRGRFAPHTKNKGCNQKLLRLPFLKNFNDLSENILWAAYWLPHITRYINWGENACADFVENLLISMNLVIKYCKVEDEKVKSFAYKICLQAGNLNSNE